MEDTTLTVFNPSMVPLLKRDKEEGGKMKDKGTMMGSHFWESVVLPGIKFSSCSSEKQLKLDFSQSLETLRRKKLLGKPLPKRRAKKTSKSFPGWLSLPTKKQLCSLEKETLGAKQRKLRDLEERRKNYVWEDALTRRAARRLWEKVGRTKETLKEKGVTVPRELLNSLKAAKWRLFQPKLHPEVRVDKWWALNRLFIDLKLLTKEVGEEVEEEENKNNQ